MAINDKQIRVDISLDKIINEVVSHHLKKSGERIPIRKITKKIAELIEEKQLKKELLENEFIRF